MWSLVPIKGVYAIRTSTFNRGTLCYKDGVLKAIIEKHAVRRGSWLVWRISHPSSGEQLGGCEVFRSFEAAQDFVINNPGVWGK